MEDVVGGEGSGEAKRKKKRGILSKGYIVSRTEKLV